MRRVGLGLGLGQYRRVTDFRETEPLAASFGLSGAARVRIHPAESLDGSFALSSALQVRPQVAESVDASFGVSSSSRVSVPSDFGTLVAWFRADQGTTIATGVSQWNDLSG